MAVQRAAHQALHKHVVEARLLQLLRARRRAVMQARQECDVMCAGQVTACAPWQHMWAWASPARVRDGKAGVADLQSCAGLAGIAAAEVFLQDDVRLPPIRLGVLG